MKVGDKVSVIAEILEIKDNGTIKVLVKGTTAIPVTGGLTILINSLERDNIIPINYEGKYER